MTTPPSTADINELKQKLHEAKKDVDELTEKACAARAELKRIREKVRYEAKKKRTWSQEHTKEENQIGTGDNRNVADTFSSSEATQLNPKQPGISGVSSVDDRSNVHIASDLFFSSEALLNPSESEILVASSVDNISDAHVVITTSCNQEPREEQIRGGNHHKTAPPISNECHVPVATSKSSKTRKDYEREKKRNQRANLRANQLLHDDEKRKERDRYYRRKVSGEIRLIGKLNKTEQESKRLKWRQEKAVQKSRNTMTKSLSGLNSAIQSSSKQEENEKKKTARRKRRLRQRRKALENELDRERKEKKHYKKLYETNKKRLQRLKEKYKEKSLNPKEKAQEIMKKGDKEILHNLIFAKCIEQEVKDNLEKVPRYEKMKYMKLFVGPSLKKYKVTKMIENIVSLHTYKRAKKLKDLPFKNRSRLCATMELLKKEVSNFYCNDENSVLAPGKKDCLTFKKVKRQKRYLTDTLKNLHKKFVQSHRKIGFSTFAKLRPFFVVRRLVKNCDTCVCIHHENFELKLQKLKLENLVLSDNVTNLVNCMTCKGITLKNCMMRTCDDCKEKSPIIKDFESSDYTFYYKWVKREDEQRNKRGEVVKFTVVVRDKVPCTLGELVSQVTQEIPQFFYHLFVIYNQFKFSKKLKSQLSPGEAIINVDFSENFSCKYSREVQSMHYGASRRSLTLHTGVLYTRNPSDSADNEERLSCKSFCSISDDPRHTAPAVWAHLQPILKLLRSLSIVHLHFFSDGPTGQYKNKNNFFLLYHYARLYGGFKFVSWNFWATGHGKGPSDGVGAVCKRTADDVICREKVEVTNAETFIDAIKEVKIELYHITSSEIDEISELVPSDLNAVNNTMQMHQVIWSKNDPNLLQFRHMSCIHSDKFSLPCLDCPFIDFSFDHTDCNNNADGTLNTDDVEAEMLEPEIVEPENRIAPNSDIFKIGDWVTVVFGKDWYPGSVVKVEKKPDKKILLTVNFLRKKETKLGIVFNWPNPKDTQEIYSDGIFCKLLKGPKPNGRSERSFVFEDVNIIDSLFEKVFHKM